MGLTLLLLNKPKGKISFDVEEDYDKAVAHFRGDERLLDLLNEVGTEEENIFITFTEEQFKKLITISESIDDGTFKGNKEYKNRYSNETMFEFYKRWNHIINSFKNGYFRTDWDSEHLVVYISC